jgi:endonuclease I
MKKYLFVVIGLLQSLGVAAQAPYGYYDAADGVSGEELKMALHNIVKGHTSISYAQIWNAFWSTDNKGNGVVWDMYSDRPNGTPPYTYQLGMDQCGSYDGEGDCYNREHSWPQSWFNEQSTPRTDMHHIFATDGYVNGRRGNLPYGEVRSASWTSQNGSKIGTCKTPGYTGTVFEPIDEYKGDFARAFMYMSVRYYKEDSGWGNSDMTDKSEIKPWAINMLLRWNEQDPVSQKEIDRNNAIYNDYQHNRNPFVDYPEFANMIWDPTWSVDENQTWGRADRLVVYDLSGRKLLQENVINEENAVSSVKNKLKQGCYLLQLLDGNRILTSRKLLVN